jgi:hypothetical protein
MSSSNFIPQLFSQTFKNHNVNYAEISSNGIKFNDNKFISNKKLFLD